MSKDNKHQRDQSMGFITLFVVVFVDWYIEKKDTGEITMIYDVIVELENQEKPVLAAEWITKAFVKP